MNVHRWTAALAAAAGFAVPAIAHAAPVRSTTTTKYTHALFLQHALGLPASDTSPAIESVTYDRFQWLLGQPGKFAILIGDPATDASFKARAQDVEAAAQAAGAKKVYWFDPNLSGSAQVGTIKEPALDIRNPASIPLNATSQEKYKSAWLYLVGQFLGDGVTASINSPNSESATVSYSTPTSTVNGGLYDYTSGAAPANVLDSFFFIYDRSNPTAKILAKVDLSTSTTARADVAAALAGAPNLTQLDQFAWWKDEVNTKQKVQASQVYAGANNPVLTDADNADGWRVDQVTYPELVDVLKNGKDADVEILFGGTWCPNTRPVVGFVNQAAQRNGVPVVFNFDTVLDGGVAGGGTTSASDPLQSRNTSNNGSSAANANANPTWLYGDVVAQYLSNIKTEYKPASTPVTFFAGGGAASSLTSINKLQVPFVLGYQNSAATRQWIIDKGNGVDYTEYMSTWAYTSPQPNQLSISTTQLPAAAPIWQTINATLPNVTWATDPSTLAASSVIDTDDANYLVDADTAKTPTYTPASGTTAASVSAPSTNGPVSISPASLTSALQALGASAPVNYAAAKAALITAFGASTPDQTLVGNLTTVYTAWGIAQNRKTTVNKAWGNATSPASVIGGLAAVHALDVFFDGLPGTGAAQRTVTADAAKITLAIASGSAPSGKVSLALSKAGTAITTAASTVTNNAASFTLPALDAGTYDYTLSYPGDHELAPFTDAGTLTVAPPERPVVVPITTPVITPPVITKPTLAKVSKVKGAVSKAPTSRKAGKYKVTFSPSAVTGKVTLKLKKGKTTKTLTGKLVKGVVTFTVPKLAKGTWTVAISWPGDSTHQAAAESGTAIKVKK